MSRKTRVGIIFGGRSAEHEVSISSALSVCKSIDKEKFEPVLLYIDKSGSWHMVKTDPLPMADELLSLEKTDSINTLLISELKQAADVVFPLLHGTYGEDGSIQGLIKMLGIPYVGAGILGSGVAMDKDVTKRLLQQGGVMTAKFKVVIRDEEKYLDYKKVTKELGKTLFVKPANLGSSVGINKVTNEKEFKKAITEAFLYDTKILIEEGLTARELFCGVIGNTDLQASEPIEVSYKKDEFFTYEAKYTYGKEGVIYDIPAKIPSRLKKKIQDTAIRVFRLLCCQGMARVDLFLVNDELVVVNEVNTIPGFTNKSLFPRAWEASGLKYQQLITKLIEFALEREKATNKLKTTFD